MFLRCKVRRKDGKEHRTWSIVENRRVRGGRVVQRHVLYLGEINSSQREAWRKSIEIFEEGRARPRTASLFPEHNAPEIRDESIIRLRLKDLSLKRPRQWGACWLSCELYEQLGLDRFWAEPLPTNRKGTRWDQILQTVVTYRLLDPGSEWRLHREWFLQSAMADLLGADFSLAEIHKLYEVHDKLLAHKEALFAHLQERWKDLFGARFEVLLYDLTSAYFESDPPESAADKRRFGYSRDRRPDCVQVVIALVVTPEGFPLAYEVMPGNTADKTTLRSFLDKMEDLYGKADRIWLMDRGIPSEEALQQMRQSDPPISYLVGAPKGRLTKLEKDLADLSWEQVREGVEVKLLPRDGELFIFAQSRDRVAKERSMRQRRLRRLLARLEALRHRKQLKRDDLLLKIGQAKAEAGRVFGLVDLRLPQAREAVTPQTFTFRINRQKLRAARRREGRYLLRSNLSGEAPGKRLLVFFCGGIIGIGLIFTASRGGMIAGACGLFCMGLIFIFRRAQRRKGVALLGLFLVTAGYAVYIGAEYPMGRFNYFDQSLENRTRYARKTMDIYQDYPVAGIGFGNFEYVYPGYQAAKDNKRYIRFAHNDWAQFLAETGTIGPILLLTGMACFLLRTLRLWLKRHDPFALGLGTLAPAIIGTMAIHSYSDFNLHIPANFLMLAGLTACSSAALHLHCRRGRENLVFRWHCLPLKFRGTVFLFLLVGMMIWCAGGALRHFGAEANCATVHNATFNIDRQPSLENIRRAISRDSLNARYRQKLARALMKDRDDHAAEDNYQENLVRVAGIIAALQDVILLNPCETESYIRLAREYTYLWQEPDYREKWLPAADRAMESAAFFVGEKNPRQHVEMGHYWNMRAGHPWLRAERRDAALQRARWHYHKALALDPGNREMAREIDEKMAKTKR